jgi:hypothetical protein
MNTLVTKPGIPPIPENLDCFSRSRPAYKKSMGLPENKDTESNARKRVKGAAVRKKYFANASATRGIPASC